MERCDNGSRPAWKAGVSLKRHWRFESSSFRTKIFIKEPKMAESDSNITNFKLFNKEIDMIKVIHADQIRRFTLAPYWTHPIRVATLVMKYKESHEIDNLVRAALYHDSLEDTDLTADKLTELTNPLVTSLVLKLTNDCDEISKIGKAEYMKKKVVGLTKWALVIKLCDRLDNCSDFIYAPSKFITKYSNETWGMIEALESNYDLSSTHRDIIAMIKKVLILFRPDGGI
jgi:(p)ppGpp synthase/HD superfamily hydrolase